MRLETTAAKLAEMKTMCTGDPQKIAEFRRAERRYEETVGEFFSSEDGGVPFIKFPSAEHVGRLEATAAQTGDSADKARAVIMRDRLDHLEADKVKYVDWNVVKTKLTRAINNGEAISPSQVEEARRLAKHNASTENIALFSRLRKAVE